MRNFAESIVETVRYPLLVLDRHLHVVSANAPFYRTFQITPPDAVGRPVHDLGTGLWDIPRLHHLLAEVTGEREAFEDFTAEHTTPELGRRILLINARRVQHSDGTPVVLLAIEDVTEKRNAEEALRRLNADLEGRVRERTAQLEAANKELEAFCYSVSHDLRAPLRGIDGFGQELLEQYASQLDAKGQHYLQRIRAASQRMAGLIDDLLQLSRLTRSDMRQEAVDLSGLAHAVVKDLHQREPQRQVTVLIQPTLTAIGDPGLFRVLLENLLGNAWKFTSKHAEARIEMGTTRHQDRPVFFVRDDGAGFDMTFGGKLFGAFQRLHHQRDFPGTGIGLATVQRIVHRHGGKVWAEAAVDEGATFYFTLPGIEEHR